MTSKITRLSPTDVANISILPSVKRRAALENIEIPKVFWGYQPIYRNFPKLLLAESALFGHLPDGGDAGNLAAVKRACKSGSAQETANLAVARAIIDWRKAVRARGVVIHPDPFRTSADTLRFCADVAVVIDAKLYIVNLDCRSQMNLTRSGKEFVKSLMYHTAKIGDLKNAEVAILRTPATGGGERRAVLETLIDEPLYTLDEIEEMVLATYAEWEVILRNRRDGDAAAGAAGPLI